jgi:N-glycosylase/DNA lyase
VRIPVDGPLDLQATLESGQAFRWRRDGGWYSGVVFGNAVRLRRTARGVEFRSTPADEEALADRLTDYLGLSDDLDDIYRSIAVDEHVRAAIRRYRGMRILRQDPWECLVSFICSAWSNVARVSGNVEAIASRYGQPLRQDGVVRYAFPTPRELAIADEAAFRKLGLGFRAKYLPQAARLVAGGQVNLLALREAPYSEALEEVSSLPGVGDKVANCILLFSLDKREAFPVDVWIQRVLCEWYLGKAGEKMSTKALRVWAQEHFGPHAGYANHYLFHGRRLAAR